MKKALKIGLIIISILVVLFIVVNIAIWGLFVIGSMQNDRQEEQLAQQGIAYAKIHLNEKYPDLMYTVVDAEPEELYNGFTHGGWGDTVEITIDISGEEYKVYANIQEENGGICCDNIQFKEIEQAIHDKLKKISGINDNYKLELDMSHYWIDYSFYTKYNGDITAFLIEEKEMTEKYSKFTWGASIHVGYADKQENFSVTENDVKFLELFDIVAFVNFKEKIPTIRYSYSTGTEIVSVLRDRNIDFNSVWVYNDESKIFEEISHLIQKTAVC